MGAYQHYRANTFKLVVQALDYPESACLHVLALIDNDKGLTSLELEHAQTVSNITEPDHRDAHRLKPYAVHYIVNKDMDGVHGADGYEVRVLRIGHHVTLDRVCLATPGVAYQDTVT